MTISINSDPVSHQSLSLSLSLVFISEDIEHQELADIVFLNTTVCCNAGSTHLYQIKSVQPR